MFLKMPMHLNTCGILKAGYCFELLFVLSNSQCQTKKSLCTPVGFFSCPEVHL